MSDSWIDELGDNTSDRFHGNDDGIVPDSAYEHGCQLPVLGSGRKKQRHENLGSGTNHLKSNIFHKREDNMLGKTVQDRTQKDTKISDRGFNDGHIDMVENFCTADPMLYDSSAATHDDVYNYPLNNIPDTEANLSFLDNENKGSNDIFYGWGDIGNFEDVDKMLRGCDSTFGLDSLNNEDDMCWFSSAQPNEDTEATMTDDMKPDIMSEKQRNSMLQIEDFLNNSESNHSVEDAYGYNIVGSSAQAKSSENVCDTSLQMKDIMMLDDEDNVEKEQTDHLDEKSNGYSKNSFTLQHSCISREIMDTDEYYPPSSFHQSGVPYSHFNCEQPSDQVSALESKSGIKSENKPNPSSSASYESYTSNQAQSVESLQGPSRTNDDRSRKGSEKRVDFQPGKAIPPYLASPRKNKANMQESSCVSSVVDDISLEATSFRQLQQVIEQLDVNTKLCIRDSLYRLAKSAEQRNNWMNPTFGNIQEKGADSQLMTGETDKFIGFIDIETDTNPIDRTMAHLLFHRPSDSSNGKIPEAR